LEAQLDVVGFEQIYRRYARDLYRFALYLCGNQAQAEDLVSEAFVRCWTSSEPIREATVKSYLFTIARNLYLRERGRRARQTELSPQLQDAGNLQQSLESRERLGEVLEAFQQLAESDRSALLMRANDQLPYEQIADTLGLSLTAVKVKVHRARQKLARIMKGEKPE
jgi:RNA polymerase sigma-70 factor (ECF subfamily)